MTQSWNKPKPRGVPADFKVNPKQKFTGTVASFFKLSGYGFITLDSKGVVPDDKLYVYWTGIKSADRFPHLTKDMKVQFSIEKEAKDGVTTLKASEVTQPGGTLISVQDEGDAKKEYVGGQNLRYTGTLKFYSPKNGYGYVQIDEGYDYGGEDVPKEIRVERAEVNAGGKQPGEMRDVQVEFGIWKTRKGAFKAYNMTAEGGTALAGE